MPDTGLTAATSTNGHKRIDGCYSLRLAEQSTPVCQVTV
jgi:hypothetical protein